NEKKREELKQRTEIEEYPLNKKDFEVMIKDVEMYARQQKFMFNGTLPPTSYDSRHTKNFEKVVALYTNNKDKFSTKQQKEFEEKTKELLIDPLRNKLMYENIIGNIEQANYRITNNKMGESDFKKKLHLREFQGIIKTYEIHSHIFNNEQLGNIEKSIKPVMNYIDLKEQERISYEGSKKGKNAKKVAVVGGMVMTGATTGIGYLIGRGVGALTR
ncbi:hypothetical protein N9934_03580, partial [Desulfosarcina sp.]|nr:hypothetical protein [Desulfosarcina sp.]